MDTSFTQSQVRNAGRIVLAGTFLVLAGLPLVTDDQFLIRLTLLAFIWSGYATAWNMFSGYSGYISFGHAIFFGAGAFTSTWLLATYDITPWIGMFAGGLVAVVLAVVIGIVTFRAGLSGIYFALAMLSFPLIAAPVLVWLGFIEISVPFNPDQAWAYMSFRGLVEYYYIAFALLIATLAINWKIHYSRLGYYLKAINSSEEAASSLGVDTARYKIYALSLSGFLSALMGTIYIQVNYIFATHSVFTLTTSAEPVILGVAGGLGTLFGPLVAGLTLFPFAELLRSALGSTIPGIHNIVYGIVLIFIIIFLPDGIYASLRQKLMDRAKDDHAHDETPKETGEAAEGDEIVSKTKHGDQDD